MKPAQATLYYQFDDSDKIYIVDLVQEGKLFEVEASYGKRNKKLRAIKKTDKPTSYRKAKEIYDRLIHNKKKDGYSTTFKGAATSPGKALKGKIESLFEELIALVEQEKDITKRLLKISEAERQVLQPMVEAYAKKQKDDLTNLSFAYLCFFLCEDGELNSEKVKYNVLDEKFHKFYKANFSKLPAYLIRNFLSYGDNSEFIIQVDKGVLDKQHPEIKQYLMTLLSLIPFDGYFADDREYIKKNLSVNPNTLKNHIYWLIEHKGYFVTLYGSTKVGDRRKTPWKKVYWADIFVELQEKKKLDIARVVKGIFGNYTLDQKPDDLKDKEWQNQMEWGYKLLKRLELEEKTLLSFQQELIELIKTSPDGVVKLTLDLIKKIITSADFDMKSFLAALNTRIETIDSAVANKLFLNLTYYLKTETKYKEAIIQTVTLAMRHKLKKVKEKAKAFLTKFGTEKEKSTAAELAKPRVKKKHELSYENSEKIGSLLSSQMLADHRIAIQIIQSQPFPKEIINEIFATYRLNEEEAIAKSCYEMLKENGSEELMQIIDEKIPLGGRFVHHELGETRQEQYLEKELKMLEKETELIAIKIARIYVSAYNKGGLFVANAKVSPVQKEVFQHLIKEKTFVMNLALAKFPKALFHFPELEVVDLSSNSIRSVPKEIKKLKNLRALNLSNNRVTKIAEEIGTLYKLEELNLERNYLPGDEAGEIPESITKLPKLTILLLTGVGYFKDFMFPTYLMEFKNLKKFSNGPKYSSSRLENYPSVKEVTGNPIDMDYLALAFRSLEQGARTSFKYVIKRGSTEDIQKGFDLVFDKSTKTMDLRMMSLEKLPKEILAYDIEHLNLGLNDLASFPKEIFHFKQLKTLSLKSAFLISSKKPVVFTSEDFKGFADLKNLEKIVFDYPIRKKFGAEIISMLPKGCEDSTY